MERNMERRSLNFPRTAQWTHRLAVCSEIQTRHINVSCGKILALLKLQPVTHSFVALCTPKGWTALRNSSVLQATFCVSQGNITAAASDRGIPAVGRRYRLFRTVPRNPVLLQAFPRYNWVQFALYLSVLRNILASALQAPPLAQTAAESKLRLRTKIEIFSTNVSIAVTIKGKPKDNIRTAG
jgi:hypothetical protein